MRGVHTAGGTAGVRGVYTAGGGGRGVWVQQKYVCTFDFPLAPHPSQGCADVR